MAKRLEEYPVHLGRAGRAEVQPAFLGGMAWYDAYEARHREEWDDSRLVSMFRFSESWDSWEMHPAGDELIVCLSGRMTLHQQHENGETARVVLQDGEYAINPPGTWHTADIDDTVTALFITVGAGTEHRPR